ncbi:MAG: 4-hydroxy-tetrahydrodipicolinate reductase [Chitinophagaceae bacterium]|nr:4-hydroxy-tetrahydrodipicolinate reductase [Chitinophagaceae bacterium]
MKIALIGYGKMGKAIEAIAIERGHMIGFRIDADTLDQFTQPNMASCDVAIEFTGPHSAVNNLLQCFEFGIPVVSGSTGWLEERAKVDARCLEKNGSFLYASNFSVGVNIFFEVNQKLAYLMRSQPSYTVSIEEIHHTQKKDAPSGTAITLAEQVMQEIPAYRKWVNDLPAKEGEIPITSLRIDPAPGTHTVNYHSDIDDITITHTAHTRQGFAIGAVLAAEYLCGKKGIFTMKEVLGIS